MFLRSWLSNTFELLVEVKWWWSLVLYTRIQRRYNNLHLLSSFIEIEYATLVVFQLMLGCMYLLIVCTVVAEVGCFLRLDNLVRKVAWWRFNGLSDLF